MSGPYVDHVRHETALRQAHRHVLYVGRWNGSVLGNRFFKRHESERLFVITQYRHWLWHKMRTRNAAVMAELAKITADTVLLCHCHPKPCHADVISKAWQWLQEARKAGKY